MPTSSIHLTQLNPTISQSCSAKDVCIMFDSGAVIASSMHSFATEYSDKTQSHSIRVLEWEGAVWALKSWKHSYHTGIGKYIIIDHMLIWIFLEFFF